jgi:hypothetical protein
MPARLDRGTVKLLTRIGFDLADQAPRNRRKRRLRSQVWRRGGHYTSQHYPGHVRRIRFRDPETTKALIYIREAA